ncbi:MAG: pseudouridine synthase [Sandarakinorhabdus sp.]|nr:pseudouridine synthase [Sandarakinorhabdus sp.]
MRPPRKTGGPPTGSGRPPSNGGGRPPSFTGGRPPASDDRRPARGSDAPRPFRERPAADSGAPQRPARPRPPRAQDEAIFTSRRDAERRDTETAQPHGTQPQGDRRRHIPGGRLPKIPGSAPKAVPRPTRTGDRKPRNPAAFNDLPPTATAAPTGRRGRGDARVAERQAARTNSAVPVEPQRIAKLLARAGIGSRRDIERMIEQGEVALHGQVLKTPATVVNSLDGITVKGETVAALEPSRLFRFHKPAGFLTTARDPGGRPTIMDILPPGLPRVVPVGRLDMNTEGLLLLTTDGALKRALELPMGGGPRTYRVRAYGDISQPAVESLIEGVTIDGMHYGPIDAEIERRTGRNLWLTMTLTEGKNREIRRVLEHLGLQVSRLIRVAYGPIELGDLAPRDADEVPDGVVASMRKSLARI